MVFHSVNAYQNNSTNCQFLGPKVKNEKIRSITYFLELQKMIKWMFPKAYIVIFRSASSFKTLVRKNKSFRMALSLIWWPIATLGSILDSQLSWESSKFPLARWSHEVVLYPERTGHPPSHPATHRPYGFSWTDILCGVPSPPQLF